MLCRKCILLKYERDRATLLIIPCRCCRRYDCQTFRHIYIEANAIANQEFGDDLKIDVRYLKQLEEHAKGCGCLDCQEAYFSQEARIEEKYYILPSED